MPERRDGLFSGTFGGEIESYVLGAAPSLVTGDPTITCLGSGIPN